MKPTIPILITLLYLLLLFFSYIVFKPKKVEYAILDNAISHVTQVRDSIVFDTLHSEIKK